MSLGLQEKAKIAKIFVCVVVVVVVVASCGFLFHILSPDVKCWLHLNDPLKRKTMQSLPDNIVSFTILLRYIQKKPRLYRKSRAWLDKAIDHMRFTKKRIEFHLQADRSGREDDCSTIASKCHLN